MRITSSASSISKQSSNGRPKSSFRSLTPFNKLAAIVARSSAVLALVCFARLSCSRRGSFFALQATRSGA
jgi:hypothetical protein